MKRRRFSRETYAAIFARQDCRCACGCTTRILPGDKIEYNHIVGLAEGGADEPGNIEAVLAKCHKRITARQARARGKVRRIILKGGLKTRRPNAKERVLERIRRWRDMP